jgi:5-amino-6-(5-phosphoribosylamino)uracil reductase
MTEETIASRPHTTVVLAMSADGKITDARRSPPEFGSSNDKAHLESQVAQTDGCLFGASTLRAGKTAMTVSDPELLKQRKECGKPPQPVQIVCSRSAEIDPHLEFFSQSVPRWLVTTKKGAEHWQGKPEFDRILIAENSAGSIDWVAALREMAKLGLKQLAVLGGGEIVASLVEANLIDEFWLTVCPLILGGTDAPTPVEGKGFPENLAPRLELVEVKPVDNEVFLHYRSYGFDQQA